MFADRATIGQRLQLRAKRQRRKRKRLEKHAPHRAVMASTIGVATSAILVCIPISLGEAGEHAAWGNFWDDIL